MRNRAELRFETTRAGALRVAVYDLVGRCVRTLRAGGTAAAGSQRFSLDARADDGRPLESGVYFVNVLGPDGPRSSRLLILR
jgi:flagellar hook assembly protein FlgD